MDRMWRYKRILVIRSKTTTKQPRYCHQAFCFALEFSHLDMNLQQKDFTSAIAAVSAKKKESAAARIAEDYHSIIDNDHDNGV